MAGETVLSYRTLLRKMYGRVVHSNLKSSALPETKCHLDHRTALPYLHRKTRSKGVEGYTFVTLSIVMTWFTHTRSSDSRHRILRVWIVYIISVTIFFHGIRPNDMTLHFYRDESNHKIAKTNPRNNHASYPSICDTLFTRSVSTLWKQSASKIKEAVTSFPADQQNNTRFHEWVDQLFQDHYQTYQLRRSAIHPPGIEVTLKVLEIISKRVNHLRRDDTLVQEEPQLHILVTGGSLPAGGGCGGNHVGLDLDNNHKKFYSECAWPVKLEDLFNQVLFEGQNVVKVSNLATGGADSEIGKTMLEYYLFPDNFQQPDIVIWSHGVNDSMQKEKAWSQLDVLSDYINAAHNIRLCDDDLPMVVMNEEFWGQHNDISGAVYKAANWYGLMGITQRNVISHKAFANMDNETYVNSIIDRFPHVHPGLGGHIGASWTVFYNFMSAFTDACEHTMQSSSLISDYNDIRSKSIGPYKENEYGDIALDWKKYQESIREKCTEDEELTANENGSTGASSISTGKNHIQRSPCTYAFMVNRMTSISTAGDVKQKLGEILSSNSTGWNAEGFPIRHPRAAFYAKVPNAHFSLKVDASMETKYMTIVSMKSYGPNFIDSKLKVDVVIERKQNVGGDASASAARPLSEDTAEYEIDGYHETKTSIHVPHKFELPNSGAKRGDSIIVNVRLVSGSYFKIAGIAFCRF